ncbi:hypothetical protein FS749_011314 [Ceratobasidium sp. UAMH 11750]|nr:hypothetical protein FS749_011314 [Ceratobasidium sp. UAMH 11750]
MPGVCFDKQLIAKHKCPTTRTKIVSQERQETLLHGQEVQHQGDLSDLLLNAASLQSAAAIQVLQAQPKLLGTTETVAREAVILWGEEQEQAKVEKEEKDKEKEKRKVEREKKTAGVEKQKAEKEAEKQGQGSNVGKGVNPGKWRGKTNDLAKNLPSES